MLRAVSATDSSAKTLSMRNGTLNGASPSEEPAVMISERPSSFQAPIVVSEIAENCLYSGFFGRLDSARVSKMTDRLLGEVMQSGIDQVILDLSNIDVIDSLVANHLVSIAKTLKFVGCRAIFCGISATDAQTMVATGVEIGTLRTTRNLKSALKLVEGR
jgi:rsbT co-antagonist protein RsbR